MTATVRERAAAAIGLARSCVVYRWRPFRRARLRAFYAPFVAAGDLCFDIGAHLGDRSLAWLAQGARVVAVEPQPDLARRLRRRLQGRATVVEAAVGERGGEAQLHLAPRHPTLATLSEAWVAAAPATAGFAGIAWNVKVPVRMLTLDQLIASHGIPSFCKIDVEGAEAEVLAGLSQPLRALSFEFLPGQAAIARRAIARLEALGGCRYNFSAGERLRFDWPEWRDAVAVENWLDGQDEGARSGDIYARSLVH